MSSSDNSSWRPNWTEKGLISSIAKVSEDLRNGPFLNRIDFDNKVLQSNHSWATPKIKENALWDLKGINKIILRMANDAPRVLRKINNEWDTYIQLVSKRGEYVKRTITDKAKKGPDYLYYYLITYHINLYWYTSKTGYENTLRQTYEKIGSDNQFLWSMKEWGNFTGN